VKTAALKFSLLLLLVSGCATPDAKADMKINPRCAENLEDKIEFIRTVIPKLQDAEDQKACMLLADEIRDYVGSYPSKCEKTAVIVDSKVVRDIVQFAEQEVLVKASKKKVLKFEWLQEEMANRSVAMAYAKCRLMRE
jgi:hypothetical protein